MTNIIVQDVGAEKDAITSLRAPTHFGRPNWDRVFASIADKHPETDVGVVRVIFCFHSLSPHGQRFSVLLWSRRALASIAHHEQQVFEPQGHEVLLREGYAASCCLLDSEY